MAGEPDFADVDPDDIRGAQPEPAADADDPAAPSPDSGGPTPNGRGAGVSVVIARAIDVVARAVPWLWAHRIPRGRLSLIAGHAGMGKGWVAMAVTAAMTLGVALPDGEAPDGPRSVMWLEYEDDPHDTLRPRAELLGADLTRVHFVMGARDAEGRPVVPDAKALADLERQCAEIGDVALLVISPLNVFLGDAHDMYRDNETRAALQPLQDFAARSGIAVVGLAHLRKSETDDPVLRVLGSVAYTAAVRAALLVGRDPDTERRAVVQLKNNLGAERPGIELFLPFPDGLQWGQLDPELTADRLLARPAPRDAAEAGERARAVAWLTAQLADGPRWSRELDAAADVAGHTAATLRRARAEVGVVAEHATTPMGLAWWVRQPDQPADQPPPTPPPPPTDAGPRRRRTARGGAAEGPQGGGAHAGGVVLTLPGLPAGPDLISESPSDALRGGAAVGGDARVRVSEHHPPAVGLDGRDSTPPDRDEGTL
ncbi:MAG TPA: AAA family ATPase [Candidatus Dormibacteraeota bacterium]|nr:AAA family ATPase [Candidatus Dormibacteraeota bacterium]HVA20975.1 AAA family ATPase [Candidatus Micrarchaeia archaeon]